MAKKSRRIFSIEQKQEAVRSYVSGERRAADVANELGIAPQLLYAWKVQLDERSRRKRYCELEQSGLSPEAIKIIQTQREEIEAYQKKVAELTVITDLLKKLPGNEIYQSESELSGLIKTINKSDRKKGRVK